MILSAMLGNLPSFPSRCINRTEEFPDDCFAMGIIPIPEVFQKGNI